MQNENQERHSFMKLLLSGFMMGSADVVPGVSGGTIAFILGIYEDLLNAIHSINLRVIQLFFQRRFREAFNIVSWRFMLGLGSGILLAVLTIAKLLDWGLENYPQLIWSFFFGLVLASVFVIGKRVQGWTPGAFGFLVAGAVFAFMLIGLTPVETPTAPWFLFLSGALAFSAMILPGISGAFILVILGKYHYLLQALVNGNFVPLIIVAAGGAAGLLSIARLLRWLFQRYHDFTVAALMGFIIGALRKVWPWKVSSAAESGLSEEAAHLLETNILPAALTLEVGLALGLMLFGFAMVLGLETVGKRQTALVREDG